MIASNDEPGRRTKTMRRCMRALLAGLVLAMIASDLAVAQTRGDAATGVPGFWDPRRRPERPDLTRINIIRFLTEVDYPPFNYPGSDGNPTGFNIDLARLICEE